QQLIKNSHLKLTLRQNVDDIPTEINAIAWRWSEYFPLPRYIDIAYKLKENTWNGEKSLQLELVGVRLAKDAPNIATQKAEFYYKERHYVCSLWEKVGELRIKNQEGNVLVIDLKNNTAISGKSRETAKSVDINTPAFSNLINAAFQSLNSVNN
ncbi:MAG TPA: single-stranded-DNA-specific exonuclease RecJ, partial [Allocoleopsis sp.]